MTDHVVEQEHEDPAVSGVGRHGPLPRAGAPTTALCWVATATAGAIVEHRGQGMGELGATREEAAAFAGWRGPLALE